MFVCPVCLAVIFVVIVQYVFNVFLVSDIMIHQDSAMFVNKIV